MAKIVISQDELPKDTDTYFVRMRVVSLDENRTSHWIYYEVPVPQVADGASDVV